MSTLSAQFLMCSAALTEDFYHSFLRKNASSKELVWVGRLMVLIIAVIGIAIAQDPNSREMGFIYNEWAGFGASFESLVIMPVFNLNITSNALLLSIIA